MLQIWKLPEVRRIGPSANCWREARRWVAAALCGGDGESRGAAGEEVRMRVRVSFLYV